MRQLTQPPAAVLLVICGLALAVGMAGCGSSMPPVPLTPTVPTITNLPSIDEMLSEKTLGSALAANTIVEYVSFWSTNSKTFYLTGDGAQMKSQLADTNKAQILFRNLFLGTETQISGVPVAAMLARCAGNAKFFDAVNTIFQNQDSWGNSSNPDTAVQQLMLGFGMGQPLINACLTNTALLNGLGAIHSNAEQASYQLPDGTQRTPVGSTGSIFSVPAVVVNGVLFDGMNTDGTTNAAFAPTFANIQPFLK